MNINREWRITNIRCGKDERSHIVYAELHDDTGALVISATLEHIVQRIRDSILVEGSK